MISLKTLNQLIAWNIDRAARCLEASANPELTKKERRGYDWKRVQHQRTAGALVDLREMILEKQNGPE